MLLVEYWESIENRRNFFEDYAEKHAFDPLIASNWYSQSKENIMATKVKINRRTKTVKIFINILGSHKDFVLS